MSQVEKRARRTYQHRMIDRTANLLGAVGLAIADRIEDAARHVLGRAGETRVRGEFAIERSVDALAARFGNPAALSEAAD